MAGSDKIAPELWKQIVKDGEALQHLARLSNECWARKRFPQSWHKASVVSIWKKGDITDMINCRPISLLQISYKIDAIIIIHRL